MPPLISVVGISNSGKTTLVEKLTRELISRGYRVATFKHTPGGANFDEPGKDSWRYLQAGSQAAVVSAPDGVALIKPVASEASLDELVRLLGEDYDIIIAEGFKHSDIPKIEVHRKGVGSLLSGLSRLVAIVTDEPLETRARQFSPEDIKDLADLLEKGFIKPQQERTSLYINGAPVPLGSWPREVITKVILSMASSLKGVGEIKSLDIFLRRGSKETK
ncbi:MAG: molybdopterin-guanine dinucleotide biosynthesis protein B [Dehalococcoidales bacterium]|nr:molybdopterin-guanine dinucleotide biosynthesis protein B [Dehalococcoidales bacterium]